MRWEKSDPPGQWQWVIGGPTGQADSLISIGGIVEAPELTNNFWAVTFRFAKKGIDNYKLMGLYRSEDGGATWTKVSQPDDDDDKLKFANGLSMAFKPTPDTHNKLILVTRGNGIWIGTRNLP